MNQQDVKVLQSLMAQYSEYAFSEKNRKKKEMHIALNDLKMTKPVQVVYSLKKYSQLLSCKNLDYVGTRLHGGVFALQHQVRALVISIDHRARGFHESNNLPIIERDEIEGLEDIIIAGIRTEIRLNEKNINEWKAQFGL